MNARRLFGPVFMLAGILHFVIPRTYEAIVPDYLPAHRALVYASGVAEIAGGVALLNPRTRRFGGRLSIATLVAVFPANVHMALHPQRYRKIPGGHPALLARLPLQAVFIAWARAASR
ncbi:MAG: DoxX family protein [Solirubrobacteraceae bacterium]